MDPGRKIDRKSCESRSRSARSATSLGFGTLLFVGVCAIYAPPRGYPGLVLKCLLGALLAGDGPKGSGTPTLLRLQPAHGECAGRAPLHAQVAARAGVVVDHEQDVVVVHVPGDLVGARLGHDVRCQHEDAVPGADVDATLAQDAELGDEV